MIDQPHNIMISRREVADTNKEEDMKKSIKLAVLAVGCIFLLGSLFACTPDPVETKAPDAQAVVDCMTYVKAKNGLCFGVATVRRISSSASMAENMIVVQVPCDKVGF